MRPPDLRLRRCEAQSEDTRDTAAGAEIVVSAGEIGEIAPDAIDDVDAQLLSLLLAGLNDKAVAYQLGTSLRTVQRRVSHLMDLARVETRMQLGWQAARLGWSPSSSVTFARRRRCCPD